MPQPLAARARAGASCAARLGLQRVGLAAPWRALRRRAALPPTWLARGWARVALVAWMLLRHSAALGRAATSPRGWSLLAAVLMLFPASEAVVAVINRLISESVRPEPPAAAGARRRHPARAPRDGRDPGAC